jgi:hypothetical protein
VSGEQVIVEKKSQTYVLFGFFAIVCLAVIVRVALGPMSTTAKIVVCAIAGVSELLCVLALVRAIARRPGRMVISSTSITRWRANGKWETLTPGVLRVHRASKNWFLTSDAGTRLIGGRDGAGAKEVAGGIVLFGYDVRPVAQACADAGWHVQATRPDAANVTN